VIVRRIRTGHCTSCVFWRRTHRQQVEIFLSGSICVCLKIFANLRYLGCRLWSLVYHSGDTSMLTLHVFLYEWIPVSVKILLVGQVELYV
jgi:hypothetical protein